MVGQIAAMMHVGRSTIYRCLNASDDKKLNDPYIWVPGPIIPPCHLRYILGLRLSGFCHTILYICGHS